MIPLDGVLVSTTSREFLNFGAYDHQADSEDLIKDDEPFFAVNASPTGSGKTLSWLKPALDQNVDTIAVYPTNALVADQVETTQSIAENYYDGQNIGVIKATGETIAKWRTNYGVRSKGEALVKRIEESLVRNKTTILLTNPDTLVIVRKGMYRHQFVNSKFDRFQMIVLDEFHLADVKQRDTLLFLIDEMDKLPANQSRTDRFYFLSATPEDETGSSRGLVTRLIEDLDVDVKQISAQRRPTSKMLGNEDWKAVMPEVDLTLRESQTFRTAENLLSEEVVDDFVEFCRYEDTVVMLDGVHEVDQVYETLNERLDSNVRRITGFHKGNIASKIEDFDILVSNAAVEVGLDFKPDRLVFSAHDAATLIQRLGRLRDKEEDDPLLAWCFVPAPVRASLLAAVDTESQDDRMPRSKFENAVNAAFAKECDLSSFSRRWGELEAFQHVMDRVNDVPSESEREAIMERGLNRIERHYYKPYNREFDKQALKRLHKWTDCDLINELKSYRGSGLQVMVKDQTDDVSPLKLYDIFYLLRWGQIEFLPPAEFESTLSNEEKRYYQAYSDYAVGFCIYEGKISTNPGDDGYSGRSVMLHAESSALHRMKNESDVQRTPEVVDGLAVDVDTENAPPINGASYLRDIMTEAKRLCYIVPGHSSTVKTMYGLGEFFFLYPLGEDSIAMGLNALYLHCLVQDRIESEEREWGWDD